MENERKKEINCNMYKHAHKYRKIHIKIIQREGGKCIGRLELDRDERPERQNGRVATADWDRDSWLCLPSQLESTPQICSQGLLKVH
jgi:hypothetical protein